MRQLSPRYLWIVWWMDDDNDDLDGLGRYEQTCSSWVCRVWEHNHHDGMWQDSLIECNQSEMDDDDFGRDDWYKQFNWSGVSHINVCEGIRVENTKKVRERDEDGWEGRRDMREVSWEKTPFGKEVRLLLLREWREWECDDEWNGMRMERDLRLILL